MDNLEILQCTSESQGHGKAIEKSIQTNIFKMTEEEIKTYVNTDPHDIRKEHNKLDDPLLKDKHISIKMTQSNTICCSKFSRFLDDILESETSMIVSKWVQKNPKQKEVIKTYIINLPGLISKLKGKENFEEYKSKLKKDVLEFENDIHNLPKGKISNDYLAKGKELENKYPDIFNSLPIRLPNLCA